MATILFKQYQIVDKGKYNHLNVSLKDDDNKIILSYEAFPYFRGVKVKRKIVVEYDNLDLAKVKFWELDKNRNLVKSAFRFVAES